MNQHDNLQVVETMNYCKADLQTGKPLVVANMIDGTRKNVRKWKIDLFDKNGQPVRLQCEFGNSTGKAKASGARAVLEVRR